MEKLGKLKMNLQCFANGEANNGESKSAESSAGTQNTEQSAHQNNEVMIPKDRFDEVNNKYKESAGQLAKLKKQLEAMQNAQKQTEIEAQKEQGKYKELYDGINGEYENAKKTIEKYESRAQELEGYISKMLEVKIEKVPKEQRDLIPEGLTPEQKLAWLEKAEAKGLFARPQEKQIGAGTNPQQKQNVDLSKLSPFQLFQMGYKNKK